jgi:hypothetical protein
MPNISNPAPHLLESKRRPLPFDETTGKMLSEALGESHGAMEIADCGSPTRQLCTWFPATHRQIRNPCGWGDGNCGVRTGRAVSFPSSA